MLATQALLDVALLGITYRGVLGGRVGAEDEEEDGPADGERSE